MTIAERIRATRKEKGMTQKQVGDICGMPDSAVRKYELGAQVPKISTLQRIADALGVSIGDLLGQELLSNEIENQMVRELVTHIIDKLNDASDLMIDQIDVKSDDDTESEFRHFAFSHILPACRSVIDQLIKYYSDIIDMVEIHYLGVCNEENRDSISKIANTVKSQLKNGFCEDEMHNTKDGSTP